MHVPTNTHTHTHTHKFSNGHMTLIGVHKVHGQVHPNFNAQGVKVIDRVIIVIVIVVVVVVDVDTQIAKCGDLGT